MTSRSGKPAMGEVVNLNRFRKAKARAEKARTAATNRVKFGRTKAERESEASELQRALTRHAGHELDRGPKEE